MKFIYFTYIFLFACLFKVQANQQQQPKDCVKHPQIIKQAEHKAVEKPKVVPADKTAKTSKAFRRLRRALYEIETSYCSTMFRISNCVTLTSYH